MLAVTPDPVILAGLDVGLVGLYPTGSVVDVEVRAFFPGNGGLAEDPVTGSLNAALAQWLTGSGLFPSDYVASQGTVLGRRGRVHVSRKSDTVWIGGGCVTVVAGTVAF